MHGGYEDWEFWINAYKHGFKFKRFSEILFYYRVKESSMYTDAIKKDLYLKSKIVLNHPELYPVEHVKRSIQVIRDTESLPDLYFYIPVDFSLDQKYMTEALRQYLTSEKIQEKQFIDIPESNKKIILYTLDILKDNQHLKQLYINEEGNFVLFYSSFRYKIPTLKNLNFAWDNDKGIIEAKGSIFPFVFKSIREDDKSQLVAHQRFYRYNKEVFEPKTEQQTSICKQRIQNRDKMIQNREILISKQKDTLLTIRKDREKMIQNREKTIKKKENLISKQNDTLYKIRKMGGNLVHIPALLHPIKKYKAYKNLIKQISKI